jgi:hypothetical protein
LDIVNEDGQPDGHFLRKLKRIALHAGLNCGHCTTTITMGRYDKKLRVKVSCKDQPVCQHIYLHRLRKSCASRREQHGVPIRTIQHYLGHKNLETTMIYLGIKNNDELRGNINRACTAGVAPMQFCLVGASRARKMILSGFPSWTPETELINLQVATARDGPEIRVINGVPGRV